MSYEEPSIYLVSALYWLVVLFLITPPQEARSAGLTLENIFWKLLGSESIDFVGFHLRRTTMTRLVLSVAPFGYFTTLAATRQDILQGRLVPYVVLASVILAAYAILSALYCWHMTFSRHHFARVLAAHGSNWTAEARSINTEFRRIDKFTSGPINGRVVVTDSWLLKLGIFHIRGSKLMNTCLTLVNSAEVVHAEADVMRSTQRISMRVTSTNEAVGEFVIHIPALEYRDFRARLPHVRIVNVRGIVVQQTISERFAGAFIEQVDRNQTYRLPAGTEVDPCLGCMQATPNAKLVKLCAAEEEGTCRSCQCRPQWCLSCMSRWFSSRQDQQRPETWLSSTAPCPNCRSVFCMLDVCRVEGS